MEEHNRDGGLYTCDVTPIFDNNTAAEWVKAAMKLYNPTLSCIVYHGQQADSTDRAQMPIHGGRSYLPLDYIHPPPADDMIDDIGQESDDDAEMWPTNQTSFPTTKRGFQKFKCKLQKRITRQQRYHEVIRNHAHGLFADYDQTGVADEGVAWLREHNHIVNPPAAGSLANRKLTSSRPAAP